MAASIQMGTARPDCLASQPKAPQDESGAQPPGPLPVPARTATAVRAETSTSLPEIARVSR